MKLLILIAVVFISYSSHAQDKPPEKNLKSINAAASSGLKFYTDHITKDEDGIYTPKSSCLTLADDDTNDNIPSCKEAYNTYRRLLSGDSDENKERRIKSEQECKTALEKFDTARTEMLENCTAGNDCEAQVRTCLECRDKPELCEFYDDEDSEKKLSDQQQRLNAMKDKFQMCPVIASQSIDKAKETLDDLKEKKEEKSTEVQEGMQELVQKRNKDKVEVEEMENELLELQKQLTQAMQDRQTLMQEAELEVKQQVAELDNNIKIQTLKVDEANQNYLQKKEELIDAETEIQVACYDQANAKLQAQRERSLGALATNRTLLNNTNQFLTQASRRLSTNQNAIFNNYFTTCWSKDKKTALQRNGLKRKEKLLEQQYKRAVATIEESVKSMQDQRKLLVEQAGLAVQKAATKADRKISEVQSQIVAMQRKIASKKQEQQTTLASDAQKLMHNQQQLSNISKEQDFAQKLYDLHAKNAKGESTEPGEISKAITKYQVALDKASAAVRLCSGTDESYGDCSSALKFLERSDLDDMIPSQRNCEDRSGTGSNSPRGIN